MSNNKQTSVDIIYQGMSDKIVMQDLNKALICIHISHDDFLKLHKQAKAMHKEECIKYYVDSVDYGDMGQHIRESLIQIAEKMYNETYGGDEQ